eukprot:36693-Prorocentrum_lima.AAC.1
MTSSLVGSEMCIRDSLRVAGAYPQQHSVVAPATAPAVASLKLQLQNPVGPSAPELVLPQQAYPQYD